MLLLESPILTSSSHSALSVPVQAGGASSTDERAAHQGLRPAGADLTKAGAGQPPAGLGEPYGPAEDTVVRQSFDGGASVKELDRYHILCVYHTIRAARYHIAM